MISRRRTVTVGLLATFGAVAVGCGRGDDFAGWDQRFHWGAQVEMRDGGGTYADTVAKLERSLGAEMTAGRVYARWDDEFPSEAATFLHDDKRVMVFSIKPIRADGSRIPWADIAEAAEGSSLDDEMEEWAKRFAKLGRPVYVAFHHEPETVDDQASGRPREYRAAFERFTTELRSGAGPLVKTMWIMTDLAFTKPADDRQSAERWYPGDDAVDAIGVDAFNWFTCRGRGEPWRSISELMRPALRFSNSHPDKPLWIGELGSVEDPARPGRKAEWLAELPQMLAEPEWASLRGILYFDDVHGKEFPECDWWVQSTPEAATAFGRLGEVPAEREPPTTAAS